MSIPPVSVLLTSFPAAFAPAARQASRLGFACVDVEALAERPAEDLEVLAETGLIVACAALGRGLSDGHAPDSPSVEIRRSVLEKMERQVADAARLGATRAYLVPGSDARPEGLTRFSESCRLLADYAGGRMVRLCVEHMPQRALPTVVATLDWLRALDHPNLRLLLDVGHCLLSREDPAQAVAQAGPLLGCVHWDDNDGVEDLHRPLLTGCLTPDVVERTLAALHRIGYDGPMTLELRPETPNVVEALQRDKAFLEETIRRIWPSEEG